MGFRQWLNESITPVLPEFVIWHDGAGHKMKRPAKGHCIASFHLGKHLYSVDFETLSTGTALGESRNIEMTHIEFRTAERGVFRTKENSPFLVLPIIFGIIEKYLDDVKPPSFDYHANDQHLNLLYERVIARKFREYVRAEDEPDIFVRSDVAHNIGVGTLSPGAKLDRTKLAVQVFNKKKHS